MSFLHQGGLDEDQQYQQQQEHQHVQWQHLGGGGGAGAEEDASGHEEASLYGEASAQDLVQVRGRGQAFASGRGKRWLLQEPCCVARHGATSGRASTAKLRSPLS